jgi:hypothetical protein
MYAKTRGCECSFGLLMMGGVSPKTCWASCKYGIRNFDTLLHLVGFFCIKIHFLNNIFNKKKKKKEKKKKKKNKKAIYRLKHSNVRKKWEIELQVPRHRSVEKVEDNNDAYIRVRMKYMDIHKVLSWGTILSRIRLEHFLLFILLKPTICTYKIPICPITIQYFLSHGLAGDCHFQRVTPVFKTW